MKRIAAIALLGLAGCGTTAFEPYTPPPLPTMTIQQAWDANEVAWFKEKGTNSIEGSALLRQGGGGVVTCAGNEVRLYPYSGYGAERMRALYGNPNGEGLNSFRNFTWVPDVPEYHASAKTTTCDAQGKFRFRDLPDGLYYVGTVVNWQVGYRQQGGSLAQRIELRGGETKDIVLTAN